MTTAADASNLPRDWADAIADHGYDSGDIPARVADIYGVRGAVFPPRSDVFRAFHLAPLHDVRVVILGQDPYPRPGQAHGLAFSVPDGVPLPWSLKRIYANLENDPAIPFSRPTSGDLTPWARSGVLLLNTALTVEEGRPGAHGPLWKAFTDVVLQVINETCGHVVFLLWGSPAIRTAASTPLNDPPHKVIRSAHPAARGRIKERSFMDCRPFSEANDFLIHHHAAPVNWELPASDPPPRRAVFGTM